MRGESTNKSRKHNGYYEICYFAACYDDDFFLSHTHPTQHTTWWFLYFSANIHMTYTSIKEKTAPSHWPNPLCLIFCHQPGFPIPWKVCLNCCHYQTCQCHIHCLNMILTIELSLDYLSTTTLLSPCIVPISTRRQISWPSPSHYHLMGLSYQYFGDFYAFHLTRFAL